MSDLVIHTRCLSVRDPWGTYLSMHLSRGTTRPSIIVTIATRDTSLDNSNHRGARYVPQNGTSSLSSHSFSTHITLFTIMSQNNANDMFTQIRRYHHFHNIARFTTIMIQKAFQTILHYQHITHNQLFTLPFITLCFHH